MERWKISHHEALAHPQTPHERAMVALLRGWTEYGLAHRKRYESTIGDDGFLGPAWQSIGQALLTLLNGDTGRLDCGTVDGHIRTDLEKEGFGDE